MKKDMQTKRLGKIIENDRLKTVTVETVRYKQTPGKFPEPNKRGDIERKPPRRKK